MPVRSLPVYTSAKLSDPTAPLYIRRVFRPFPFCPSTTTIPSPASSPHASNNASTYMPPRNASPSSAMDSPPLYHSPLSDSEQMLFGPLDFDERRHYDTSYNWDSVNDFQATPTIDFAGRPSSASGQFDYNTSPTHDKLFDSDTLSSFAPIAPYDENNSFFSRWLNESELLPSDPATAPIPIPAAPADSHSSLAYYPYVEHGSYVKEGEFSPTINFSDLSLPSPSSSFERPHTSDGFYAEYVDAVSPPDTSLLSPAWAAQLWDTPSSSGSLTLPSSVEEPTMSQDAYATLRQRIPIPRRTPSLGQVFQSSSAPSAIETRTPRLARAYSRRAESVCEDHDATVRKKRRSLGQEEPRNTVKASEIAPQKSTLHPPKLAPSAWQLYFTDWIQRHQATSNRKLNVAQAAKEAGQDYADLSVEEKEPFKLRSQALKETREREYDAYIRSLTPDEIKRENHFRAAQRKAGKSRKGNIKDPNAPKKPLSAYFMFLQRIRSDPELVLEVFGDETETTKQSVLAAHKWRSMTDDERKPFLAQAEQEKMEYEAARRLYEEGTVGFETSINFSVLPGSPMTVPRLAKASPLVKSESFASSESESEGFTEDDGDTYMRS